MSNSPSEVLVIRLSSLGDVVLASAVLRGIARAIPAVRLTFATKLAYLPLFEHFDVPIGLAAYHPGQSLLSYRRCLSRVRYDCIIDLHGSIRSVLLSRSLRALQRSQIKKNAARRRLMVRKKAGLDYPLSALQTYRDALKLMDLPVDETLPGLRLSVEEHHRVAFLKSENPACIGIGWGARWPTKVVPSHVWDAVLSRLDGGRFGSVRLFGLNSDRAEMAAFAGEAQAKHPSLHMHIECGHPLREVMTRIASCAVFVSSDSGLMHLAAALEVPTFGLFGPTHPALGFAPVGAGARAFHGGTWCSPCHRHGAAPCFRERRFCFDDLNSGEIAAAITNAITKETGESGAHG